MSEAHEPDIAEVEREERKIVEETQMAGGTIHEFNPDASPQEKAAALKKVRSIVIIYPPCLLLKQFDVEHATGPGFEKCGPRNRANHRYRTIPLRLSDASS